ncbi:Prephenate dehydrogenase [Fomitopsis betulina]|nr:Prephenate dehydrogenase [Fomitopsis betulina]KAI0736706.1 Prephenate dehydrogenase [Fomitopsis betulina]
MINPDVTPDSPIDEQPAIGVIGMGSMGTMYAKFLCEGGWKKIYVCDQPAKYETLKAKYEDNPHVHVLADGHQVSRVSDFIMYSVEAEFIEHVVATYGPSTKVGAIVSGQTSVKAPEKLAFEKYLPQDVHIVSCHSLHGPTVSPLGQPLVLIRHRAPDWALRLVENILRPLRSRYVYLSYEDHDIVTANTQAVTHAAFLSMGTAWSNEKEYPWETGHAVGGIETVKVNIMLRIYSNKWHVYAGLAILNPSAKIQIDQYARSTTEIYKLMIMGDDTGMRRRIYDARDKVFGTKARDGSVTTRAPILLSEDILDRFSLWRHRRGSAATSTGQDIAENGDAPPNTHLANSHLSLLAMVDCWAALGIQPFVHLDLAATPLFRMLLGVSEYLFRSQARLDHAIHAALYDTTYRANDLEFVVAARGWSQCISFGSFELYKNRFMETCKFFEPRFEDATKLGSAMLQALLESSPSP